MAIRRRLDREGWITLPADGRAGDAPTWPLSRPSSRELALWAREWRRPQAIQWERNGQQEEVALYVRTFAAAERRNAPVTVRTLLRQQQEALGLSLPGMLRQHWQIGAAAADVAEPAERPTGTETASVKTRFRVLAGGQG